MSGYNANGDYINNDLMKYIVHGAMTLFAERFAIAYLLFKNITISSSDSVQHICQWVEIELR